MVGAGRDNARTMIIVDETRCQRVADILRRIEIPASEEDEPLGGLTSEDLPNFYLAVVAICHQTSPIGGMQLRGRLASGTELFGWDYLRSRWAEQVADDPTLNTPERWERLSGEDVDHLFADRSGKQTLNDPVGRALLLRDIGEHFRRTGLTQASDLLRLGESKLESESPSGMYSLLSAMRAYRDPVRKKSSFFLELMRNQCGWKYVDLKNLGAPVDYHEVRGHLRLGTVTVEDRMLLDAIQRKAEVTPEQDIAIRMAVYKAIQRISQALPKSDPATLHYLFWNLFRRCCARVNQHCDSCGSLCGLPVRYRNAFAPIRSDGCVFRQVCANAGAGDQIVEHMHSTDYY